MDLDRRLKEHFLGFGCRTTKLDPPSDLVYQECYDSIEEAERREYQIKRWVRVKKEALIRGDPRALKTLARCRSCRR